MFVSMRYWSAVPCGGMPSQELCILTKTVRPDAKFIMIMSEFSEEEREEMFDLGADAYLMNSENNNILLSTIKSLVKVPV